MLNHASLRRSSLRNSCYQKIFLPLFEALCGRLVLRFDLLGLSPPLLPSHFFLTPFFPTIPPYCLVFENRYFMYSIDFQTSQLLPTPCV